MASKHITLVAAALGLAVAAGAAWWLQKPAGPKTEQKAEQRAERGGTSAPQQAQLRGQDKATGAKPVAVEVARVQQTVLRDDAEAVGSLRSRQNVVLRPEVAGRVTHINFRDGERVTRGQLLVQLDDQLQRAQVQQSQAELSIARANHQRNQELVSQGFISQRSLDESAANLEVAEAKLALAQATAARLRIVAPFNGVAGIRSVNVGDYLKDGADIVNIEDLDAVYVDFRLPERLQGKIRTGQVAAVAVDALPGAQFSAVVQAISPQIDADGRSLAVRGCIDNRRLQLRPGMFARVTAQFGVRNEARVVPEEAVVPQGGRQFVLKVVNGDAPGTQVARRVEVQLGARKPGLVEVLQGLELGDTVVVAGQQRLQRDATPVRVVSGEKVASAAPAAPAHASAPASAAAPAQAGGNPCLLPMPAAAPPVQPASRQPA